MIMTYGRRYNFTWRRKKIDRTCSLPKPTVGSFLGLEPQYRTHLLYVYLYLRGIPDCNILKKKQKENEHTISPFESNKQTIQITKLYAGYALFT